ncbi:MAG: radical SAM protein [Smithella sp.]
MSKKILLINPWIYDFAAYDFWLKPLGLLSLGSLLRRNNHEVNFIDCLDPYHPAMTATAKKPQRHAYGDGKFFREIIEKPDNLQIISRNYCRYGITPDIFREELSSHQDADIVLVTSLMTYWYPGVVEAIKIIRELLPQVPVVLGGKYATLCSEHAVKFSGADYIIRGAGEEQIFRLLNDLFAEKQSFEPGMEDLDALPYPALDLVRKLEQAPIMTSRGCPFTCSYCASHIFNDKFRRRDPLKVVDEIEYWQKNFGVKNFTFYDDALLVNSSKMIMVILREVKKRNLSCNFHCPTGLHLREINEELSRLMFDSGFKTIRFGFETSDRERQIETGGKVKNEELKRAVRLLKDAGFKSNDIGVYLLCGLPGQRAAEVRDSIEFVWECGAKPILAEYSPIPGTEMWDEAVALSPFDIQKEPLYHNNSLLPCRNNDFSVAVYDELKKLLRKNKLE